MITKRQSFMVITTMAVLILAMSVSLHAEYDIGVDDVLQIVFWQVTELNQTAVVNSEGKLTLAVIGEITAAGLTPTALGRKIGEQVSRFNRSISQATVTVLQYNSNTVFVEGEVVGPGRYARDAIPDLWTIIKEMGGITPFGDLRDVKVIRGGKIDLGKILTVDVLTAVTSNNIPSLPKIYPHDLIQVGRMASGLPNPGIPSAGVERRQVYYILGSVARPGVYNLETGTDLLEALAIAGGTSPNADLKKIRVSSKLSDYANIYSINFDKQTKEGRPQRYLVQAEDAIIVPHRGGGLFGIGFGMLRDVVTFAGTITSTILLVDRLSK